MGRRSGTSPICIRPFRASIRYARSRDGAVEYSSYRSQTTDGSGRFAFDNLAAGEYRISVYANGFDKFAALRSLSKPSDEIHVRLRPAEQVPTQ